MTREVVTLDPEASAARALAACREHGIRHLPVVEGGRLVGMVSDRDLRDVSPSRNTPDQENTLGWVRLKEMMTREPVTIHPLETIEHAAREIYDRRIGCIPVVADGELVGIITSSDMMRSLTELVGAHGSGSWLEIEIPNQPGALASLTTTVAENRVNIAGIFLTPAQRASHRLIVLRLETTNPAGIVKVLEEAGYAVQSVESSSAVNPSLEES